jgi:hypothetical protein
MAAADRLFDDRGGSVVAGFTLVVVAYLVVVAISGEKHCGFMAVQDKRKTFNLAIKTLLTTAAAEVVLLLVAGLLNF